MKSERERWPLALFLAFIILFAGLVCLVYMLLEGGTPHPYIENSPGDIDAQGFQEPVPTPAEEIPNLSKWEIQEPVDTFHQLSPFLNPPTDSVIISQQEGGLWTNKAYLSDRYEEMVLGLPPGIIPVQMDGFQPDMAPMPPWVNRPGMPLMSGHQQGHLPGVTRLNRRHPSQMVPVITDTGEVVVMPLGEALRLEMGPPSQLAPLPDL